MYSEFVQVFGLSVTGCIYTVRFPGKSTFCMTTTRSKPTDLFFPERKHTHFSVFVPFPHILIGNVFIYKNSLKCFLSSESVYEVVIHGVAGWFGRTQVIIANLNFIRNFIHKGFTPGEKRCL